MNATRAMLMAVAVLPLGAGLSGTALAEDGVGYTYFDAGYQWTDVNYAIKQEGGQHEGVKLNASLGLADFGDVGIHLFGEYFDGEFSGVDDACASSTGDRDSKSFAVGLGSNYAITETVDVVARAGYVDAEVDVPTNSCALTSVDDDGYLAEGMVRAALSDRVELEAGYRYSDLDEADISNNDVFLGLGYHLTDWFTLRARGIVFDDDTGIELNARVYFRSFLGRDSLF